MEKELEEIITYFKGKEKPEDIAVLLGDDCLLKILSVYKLSVVERKEEKFSIIKNNDYLLWHSLWMNFSIEVDSITGLTGYSGRLIRKQTNILYCNRLIYPDTTMHKYADQYLKRKIVEILQGG